jgi:hypothetical protein
MSELTRYPTIATQLASEEPVHVFFPVCRWDRPHESGYSLGSCGKGLTDLASKRAHQAWCHPVSTHERERPRSASRLLGGSP